MKNKRQEKLLSLIAEESIETQEMLTDRLAACGFPCTQATISRDIKQLHLIKEPIGNGHYRYSTVQRDAGADMMGRLNRILQESVLSVDFAENMVVIKTMPGLANAAAAALDGMEDETVVGSIAGDDTVLAVMRTRSDAALLCEKISTMRK